ncbi:hypothetical protein HYDPIDRAFT_28304 [Hydnomerulius pinastri MD-312]|uniref:DUF6533 domain-containing protein n=1 Tax=Hydnomerulius pinastri MD-312 TaxID=994086 RepID=A0A0C9WAH0_9AGAM|nr:hypothetical protein HYDPIDRAFT_28304 [Hydnomerulius pinastri MD-312]
MDSGFEAAWAALQLNNYMSVGAATAIAYDYVLTLPEEIEHIWMRRWTLMTLLFFVVRYVGLPVAMSLALCTALYLFGIWGYFIFLSISDFVMILRVYAMYHRSKLILGIILGLYIPAVIAIFVCTAVYYNPKTHVLVVSVADAAMSQICTQSLSAGPQIALYLNVTRIVLSAVLCVLVVARFVKHSSEIHRTLGQWHSNRYMKLLARESVLFFIVNLFTNILSLSVSVLANQDLSLVMLVALTGFLPYLLAPRLIISMRAFHALVAGNPVDGVLRVQSQRWTAYGGDAGLADPGPRTRG